MTEHDDLYELTVICEGFHGPRDIPIRGRRWRAWNEHLIACDMTHADAKAMERAARCGMSDCTCGGYPIATPVGECHSYSGHDLSGTYAIPVTWIDEADGDPREECPDIARALDECEAWAE